jgi:hypothetical protein
MAFHATLLHVGAESLQSVGLAADAVRMSHRFIPALLCAVALAAFPAAAAAQTPPDERANARAFADVGIRLDAQAGNALDDIAIFNGFRCKADRRLNQATSRQQDRALRLMAVQEFGILGRALAPALEQAVTDLDAVPTADPALEGGREGWRQIDATYRRAAKFPHVRLCSELRRYARHGFKATPAMRRANKTLRAMGRLQAVDVEATLAKAADRMIELGVPAADAHKFSGEEDEGPGYEALAPRSPLKLLRAAS